MYTMLIGRDLATFLLCLWYSVFTGPSAFLDQISCCAIGNIGLGHERGLFAKLLCNSRYAGANLGVRLLDRLGPDVCCKTLRNMI
jgi:hypothetical protein